MSDFPSQPLAGVIEGGAHRLIVRVYYEDTDFSGLVYHASHLKFFERGRSDYLRLLGIHHHELAAQETPLVFAVAEIHIRYRAAARIDDILTVTSRLTGLKGAQLFVEQAITRGDALVAEARLSAVCLDGKGAPRRLPKPLMDVIKAHLPVAKDG